MQAFEYVSPANKEQVATLLGENAAILAGGTDLLALMKDYVVTPNRLVNIKQIDSLRGISYQPGNGLRIGALTTIAEFADAKTDLSAYPGADRGGQRSGQSADSQCRHHRRQHVSASALLVFSQRPGTVPQSSQRQVDGAGGRQSLRRHSWQRWARLLRQPFDHRTGADRLRRQDPSLLGEGRGSGVREIPLEKFFVIPKSDNQLEHDLKPGEMVIELVVPPPARNLKVGVYEVRQKAAFDWPLAMASVALEMDGETVKSARVVLGQVAPVPWVSPEAGQALIGKSITPDTAMAAANAALAGAKPLSRNKYKITLAKVAVKRAVLNAQHNSGGAA